VGALCPRGARPSAAHQLHGGAPRRRIAPCAGDPALPGPGVAQRKGRPSPSLAPVFPAPCRQREAAQPPRGTLPGPATLPFPSLTPLPRDSGTFPAAVQEPWLSVRLGRSQRHRAQRRWALPPRDAAGKSPRGWAWGC